MSAIEILVNLTQDIYFQPDHFWLKDEIPGQAFNNLSKEIKEELRNLKSSDLKNIRLDLVQDLVAYCGYKSQWAKDYRRRRHR